MQGNMMLKLYFVARIVLIIFAITMAVSIMFFNGAPFVYSKTPVRVSILTRIIVFLVLLIIIPIVIQRDTYLPFLGQAVLPLSVLKDDMTPEHASIVVNVKVNSKEGTKVIYWAANPDESGDVVKSPFKAYADYKNAGIAKVDNGIATLKLNCPSRYSVPFGTLSKHIHYRLINDKGMMSRVHTVMIDC